MPSVRAHRPAAFHITTAAKSMLLAAIFSASALMAAQQPTGSGASAAVPPAPPPPRPTVPPVPKAPVPETEIKDPIVTLLEPGAEPRQALRLKAKQGATAAFELLMNMKMSMSMGAGAPPMEQVLPGMRMVTQMGVTDVKPTGDIAYQFEYTESGLVDTPGVSPMVANQMKGAIESIKGIKGTGVLTPRFFSRDVEVDAAQADPMIKQQIDQMSQVMSQVTLPLPEEPVGAGAKWRVESEIESGGMRMKIINNVTLKDIKGDVITLQTDITQSAEPQDVMNPQMPPNAKLRLNSLKGGGTGAATLNLTRVAPLSGEASITSDVDMTISMPNMPQPQNMTQHMEITSTIKDAPATPATTQPTR
jgi:hypothetical protein